MDFMQLRTSLAPISKNPSGEESGKAPAMTRTGSLHSTAETPAFGQKLQESLRKSPPNKKPEAKDDPDGGVDARKDNLPSTKTAREPRAPTKVSKYKAAAAEWNESPGLGTQPSVLKPASPQPTPVETAPKRPAITQPSGMALSSGAAIRAMGPVIDPSRQAAQGLPPPTSELVWKPEELAPGLDANGTPVPATGVPDGSLSPSMNTSPLAALVRATESQNWMQQPATLASPTQENLLTVGQSPVPTTNPWLLESTSPEPWGGSKPSDNVTLLGGAAPIQATQYLRLQQQPPTSANEFVDVLADRMGLDLDLATSNRPPLLPPFSSTAAARTQLAQAARLTEAAQLAEQIANLGSQVEEFYFDARSSLSTPQSATLVPNTMTTAALPSVAAMQSHNETEPDRAFFMMISAPENTGASSLSKSLTALPENPTHPMATASAAQVFPMPLQRPFPQQALTDPWTQPLTLDVQPRVIAQGSNLGTGSLAPVFSAPADLASLAAANPAPLSENVGPTNHLPAFRDALFNSATLPLGSSSTQGAAFLTGAVSANKNLFVSPNTSNLSALSAGLSLKRNTLDSGTDALLQQDRDQSEIDGHSEKVTGLDGSIFPTSSDFKSPTNMNIRSTVSNPAASAATIADTANARALDAANRMVLQGQTGQARMTIRDSSIGSVDVLVSVNGRNSVAIDLQTNSSDIKKKLEGQVEDLKERLHGQKFQSVDIKVVADNQAGAGFDASQGRGQNRDNQSSRASNSDHPQSTNQNSTGGRNPEQNSRQSFAAFDSNNGGNKNGRDGSRSNARQETERIQNGTGRNTEISRYSGSGPTSINAKGNLNFRA